MKSGFLLAFLLLAFVRTALAFETGCNYWASHAGIRMWNEWDASSVSRDLATLRTNGVTRLRVFPLWSDFQPIGGLYGPWGAPMGMAFRGGPMPNTAGVDPEMMKRFRFLCDEAKQNGQTLIVGLLTGWMSGRRFVPAPFEGANVITDPSARMWEVRFVRHFVREMRDHSAIVGWDLGNECNCMAEAKTPEIAWGWMDEIASAIRTEDATRPVIAGMHGCSTALSDPWNLAMQGELADVLTTHPYPLFTPDCNLGPFDGYRNVMHPAAETLLYSGVSGRPGIVEEAGSLGPNVCSDERAAGTLRAGAFMAWASGIGEYLWWCAFDQDRLDYPPYEWNALERELGLMTADRKAKPELLALKEVREAVDALGFDLPPRRVDAVCLVSQREKAWDPSFGAFLLARQAGYDIAFVGAEGSLPDARAYILPSGGTFGFNTYPRRTWEALREKVRGGATLIVSRGEGACLSGLEETAGVRVENTYDGAWSAKIELAEGHIERAGSVRSLICAVGAKTLAADAKGNAYLTEFCFGKGKVFFINCALERMAVKRGDCFAEEPNPWYLLYRTAFRSAGIVRRVECDDPAVAITEHQAKDGRTVVVAVNASTRQKKVVLRTTAPITRVFRGKVTEQSLEVPAMDAAIFEIR